MSVKNVSRNVWEVRVRTRNGGTVRSRKQKVHGPKAEALRVEAQLRDELLSQKTSSLTSKVETLGDALKYYEQHSSANLVPATGYLNRLHREMGSVRIGELTERWAHYFQALKRERGQRTGELLRPKSLNNLLGIARTALNLCVKHGLIEKNPLAPFDRLPAMPRDRVLSADEESRLLEALKGDWLYWPVRFALDNPIRKSDLFTLTRENLDEVNGCVHFYASKTKYKKPRETFLHRFGDDMLEYFRSLPKDCPYLFPRIDERGQWYPVKDIQHHWTEKKADACIEDFTFHDLKHVAITKMVDEGYTILDLRSLGIQYSAKNVQLYYHSDARKVMQKHRENSCGPLPVAPKSVSL